MIERCALHNLSLLSQCPVRRGSEKSRVKLSWKWIILDLMATLICGVIRHTPNGLWDMVALGQNISCIGIRGPVTDDADCVHRDPSSISLGCAPSAETVPGELISGQADRLQKGFNTAVEDGGCKGSAIRGGVTEEKWVWCMLRDIGAL